MKQLTVFFASVLVIVTASLGMAADQAAGVRTYKAELSGVKIPPVATMARGEASFEVVPAGTIGSGAAPGGMGTEGVPAPSGDKALRYQLNVKDIKNVRAAHLHMGKGGTEGPVIAPLFLGPVKSGSFSGMLASGTITSKDLTGPLAGKSIDDLVALIDSGDVYVNVHTNQHPAGEIRGYLKG